jgi:hypothetical protein
MRLSTVLLLALAASLPVTPAVCAAAPEAPEAATESVSAPDHSPGVPWHYFWPGGLCLGYISMDLKRHLQRRGHEPAGRDQAFTGLISLNPRPRRGEPSGSAAPPVSHGKER